jgi:hypothetical protein
MSPDESTISKRIPPPPRQGGRVVGSRTGTSVPKKRYRHFERPPLERQVFGLMTKAELAAELCCTIETLERWMRDKTIPYVKINQKNIMFRIADMRAALDRLTVRQVH